MDNACRWSVGRVICIAQLARCTSVAPDSLIDRRLARALRSLAFTNYAGTACGRDAANMLPLMSLISFTSSMGAHANASADSSATLGLEHLSVNPFYHLEQGAAAVLNGTGAPVPVPSNSTPSCTQAGRKSTQYRYTEPPIQTATPPALAVSASVTSTPVAVPVLTEIHPSICGHNRGRDQLPVAERSRVKRERTASLFGSSISDRGGASVLGSRMLGRG
jgi:hypothetical protein